MDQKTQSARVLLDILHPKLMEALDYLAQSDPEIPDDNSLSSAGCEHCRMRFPFAHTYQQNYATPTRPIIENPADHAAECLWRIANEIVSAPESL